MDDPVALQVELDLGAETHAEELDAHTRRVQSDLRACGIDAGRTGLALPPPNAKGEASPQPGRLGVIAPPDQFAGLIAVLMQWAGNDPTRTAAIHNVPLDRLPALAALVLAAMPRQPGRLATFNYQDGERRIQLDYDPTITDPRSLLAEIRGAVSSTVNITAQGDITIGGSVVGRDQSAHATSL